jgi:hypothetical protein
MIPAALAFAGGAFLMFTLSASEAIEANSFAKKKSAELLEQQALNTEMSRQLTWQSEETLLAREKLAAAEKELDRQSWNGNLGLAVATVATATIVAMVHEMR